MSNKNVNKFSELVIDGSKVFCVEHIPTGACAIFDYDENAKERILEESRKRRKQLTPHSKKTQEGNRLVFGKSKHGYCAVSLASVLYSYYNNVPLEDFIGNGNQIRHYSTLDLPGNYEDCRSQSLYSTKDIVMETDSRKITLQRGRGGEYIRLDLKAYGVTEYLSNAPGLLEIIGRPANLEFFVNQGGRTQERSIIRIYLFAVVTLAGTRKFP